MTNTKENILTTALRLFAVNGYEAVSVSKIAAELGITKGALYKHYENKRAIFNSIFEYVHQLDIERSKLAGVPEKDFSDVPEDFLNMSPESLKQYMTAQFYYWSENEIACNFRKMLTLEQYKSEEMTALYHKVLTSGPLDYIKNLLREMTGQLQGDDAEQMALEFYAPFPLLLNICDAAPKKSEKNKLAQTYEKYMDDFFHKYKLVS